MTKISFSKHTTNQQIRNTQPMQNIIIKERGFKRILSIDSDSKTVKGKKYGYQTAICYMAPADVASKRSVCPFATPECKRGCLYSAGHGGLNSVQRVRIVRTLYFLNHPEAFYRELRDEIHAHEKSARNRGLIPVIRLNGTSDIEHEKSGIMNEFSHLQFYDYTKWPAFRRLNFPYNFHLTYSFTCFAVSSQTSVEWQAS